MDSRCKLTGYLTSRSYVLEVLKTYKRKNSRGPVEP
jgi:hypothetical protein